MAFLKTTSFERLQGDLGAAPLIAGLIGLSSGLTCLVPRSTTAFLAAIAVSALFMPEVRAQLRRAPKFSPGLALCIGLIVYLLLNARWALDPVAAYDRVGVVLLLGLCTLLAVMLIKVLDQDQARTVASAFLIGLAVGGALLAVEVLTENWIRRAIFNAMPLLRPESAKHLQIEDGRVVYLPRYILNRNIALLGLMMWPGLALIALNREPPRPKWMAAGLFLIVATAIALSSHESSQIALVVGVIVALATWWSAKFVRRALASLWCLAFVLVVPLASMAYHTVELHKAPWLPSTAQARIIIWGYTADRVPDNFWFGIGVRSTRLLNTVDGPDSVTPPGDPIAPRTGRHSHNLFLQTWFELGLVGATLIMLSGLLVLKPLAKVPLKLRPYAYGQLAALMVIAALTWGMWQAWLLAAYAMMALYMLLVSRVAARDP